MQATLITDIQGTQLTEEERQWIPSPFLGGIILFTRNYSNLSQIESLIEEIRSINDQLVVTIDHEGGRVQRFRSGFTVVPSMGEIGRLFEQNEASALNVAYAAASVLAWELLEIGVDITYAPVLDLDYKKNNVVGDRSFSDRPDIVCQLAGQIVRALNDFGMIAVGKHFPGHGWVQGDSHHELPIDDRSLNDIKAKDLVPFQTLMSDLPWLMPAHIIYSQVDDQPAGFSPVWIKTILKGEMNFQGKIVSDDLSMEGAAKAGSYTRRSQAALKAGCDILLACNQPDASIEILKYLEGGDFEPTDLSCYQAKKLNSAGEAEYLSAIKTLREAKLI